MVQEPYLQERLEKAKKQAEDLMEGRENTDYGITMLFRFSLCQHYGIGLFDPYFDSLTIDQLALEYYLWKEYELRNDPEAQKVRHAQEIRSAVESSGASMFGDGDGWDTIDPDKAFIEQAKKDFKERQ